MILDQEFEEMFTMVSLISSGKIQAPQILSQWVDFLKKLKEALKDVPEEEKKVVMEKLKTLYGLLTKEMEKIAVDAGIPQEKFTQFLENPNNLDPKQWGEITSTQQESGKLAQDIGELLFSPKDTSRPPSEPPKKKSKKKGAKSKKKRDDWIRP